MAKMLDGKGMGWRRDLPDYRDYNLSHDEVKPTLGTIGVYKQEAPSLPSSVDLRQWCPPVDDQLQLGSCTANAGAGLVEYFQNKVFGTYVKVSRLFLYKAARNLLHETADDGAYLRTTMKALVLFGAPPEEFWQYTDKHPDFNAEPPAFCYAYGQNYAAVKYFRLDPPATPKDVLLNRIKTNIAAQLPSMFGFTVYSSIRQAQTDGKIPFPCSKEQVEGGHAILAVGYDDTMKISNACNQEHAGALLIRNSWGTGWGENGYGWLPYEYVLKGLAVDWWSLIEGKWIASGDFEEQESSGA